MLFSSTQYSRLKSNLRRRYQSRLKSLLKAAKKHPQHITSRWLQHHQDELQEYSPLRWFFLKQAEMLFFFLKTKLSDNDQEFGEKENAVFEKWNNSEFASIFLKFMNRRMTLSKASEATAKILDEHIVSLGNRHLLKVRASEKNFMPQSSLGDYVKAKKLSKLLETTLHLEGKELVLMTSSLKEMKNFSNRIENALQIIRQFSPDSWERFKAFTEVIIPIKQEEFVSYSHQELPGTSMINMYHRDFVDILDDLLHENGHHHLNYYLNLDDELIQESIDCIYYSPWRRTLRPLRGIYHAYFTFFWAFKLFSDLASSEELDSVWHVFSPQEKEKIIFRVVEELWMLEYTYQDLLWAKKQGLISELGWKLIKEQRSALLRFKKKIPLLEKQLKGHKKELKSLKSTLLKANKYYQKN